jgi:hypothetical protein
MFDNLKNRQKDRQTDGLTDRHIDGKLFVCVVLAIVSDRAVKFGITFDDRYGNLLYRLSVCLSVYSIWKPLPLSSINTKKLSLTITQKHTARFSQLFFQPKRTLNKKAFFPENRISIQLSSLTVV